MAVNLGESGWIPDDRQLDELAELANIERRPDGGLWFEDEERLLRAAANTEHAGPGIGQMAMDTTVILYGRLVDEADDAEERMIRLAQAVQPKIDDLTDAYGHDHDADEALELAQAEADADVESFFRALATRQVVVVDGEIKENTGALA